MERRYLVYCYLSVLAAVVGHLEATCGGETERISNPSLSYQIDPTTSPSIRLACKLDYAGSNCTRDYTHFKSVWRVFVIGENGAACTQAHCSGFSAMPTLGPCNSTDCSQLLYLDLNNILAEDSNHFNNSVFMCGVSYRDSQGIYRHHWAPTISFLHFVREEPPPPTTTTPTLATVMPTPTLCEDTMTTSTVTSTVNQTTTVAVDVTVTTTATFTVTATPSPTVTPTPSLGCPELIQEAFDAAASMRNRTTTDWTDWKEITLAGAPAAIVLLVLVLLFLPLLIWTLKQLQKILTEMEVLLKAINCMGVTLQNQGATFQDGPAARNPKFDHQDSYHTQASNSPPSSPSRSPTAATPMMPMASIQ